MTSKGRDTVMDLLMHRKSYLIENKIKTSFYKSEGYLDCTINSGVHFDILQVWSFPEATEVANSENGRLACLF